MASGLGVDPTKNGSGVITSGTTAEDIRRINGSLYSPGLMGGGVVTTSSSALTYTVSAGVGVVETAPGSKQHMVIPIPATTLTVTSPVGAARKDIIYAQQRTPAVDGDSNVIVNFGTTLPPRSVLLSDRTLPAGATTTSQASVSGNITYSIPWGASLGRLHYFQYQTPGALTTSGIQRMGHTNLFLPTDRLVRWRIDAVMYAMNASGFSSTSYCEMGFLPSYDNGDFVLWTTPGLHQAWGTYSFEATILMTAGVHPINFGLTRIVGPGTAATHYGLDGQGYGRRGIEFSLFDAGVAA